jgi:hypothetical protein
LSIGPAKETLWAHVEQPPRHPIAKVFDPVLLAHQVAIWAQGHEHTEMPQPPLDIHPIDRNLAKSPVAIAQGVPARTCCTNVNHLIAKVGEHARERGLTDAELTLDIRTSRGAAREDQPQGVCVRGHAAIE